MPLYHWDKPGGEILLGIWAIRESEEWFSGQWQLSAAEVLHLQHVKGRKRLEFLSARHLVHVLTGSKHREPIQTEINGKPYFPENPTRHFSISHSHEYAAAIIAYNSSVGIDIQKIVPQMSKIATRVFHREELAFIQKAHELEMLHIFWGIKEAVFKAYGGGGIDFKTQIRIQPFEFHPSKGKFISHLWKDYHPLAYEGMYYFFPDGYVTVFLSEVVQV
jgi:phosphopantetheinyl transferase